MGSGSQNVTGSFTGTGATLEVETVGFKPRVVELINYSDPGILKWTENMPDAGGFKQVDAATAILTTTGITPTGQRWCINSLALDLDTPDDLRALLVSGGLDTTATGQYLRMSGLAERLTRPAE